MALALLLPCRAEALTTSAASAVLIEQESGRVLYAQNADEERLIASITKIMTAVTALEPPLVVLSSCSEKLLRSTS